MCTDNLKGFSEIITDTFKTTKVQKCIVHQVRSSLKYVDEKDRRKVASSLRKVYTSISREQAKSALAGFEVELGGKYKYVVK